MYLSSLVGEGKDHAEQLENIYQQISSILDSYKLNSNDILDEAIYTKSISELKKNIPIRKAYYNRGTYPASTWVGVKELFLPHHLVEDKVIVKDK